jgi:hypothetical protein
VTPILTEIQPPVDAPPRDLSSGDIVEVEGQRFEVVGTPFMGCAGSSVFDEYRLFWRVRMKALTGSATSVYGTWAVGQRVKRVYQA